MRKIGGYIWRNGFLPRIFFVGFLIYLTLGIYFGKAFWLISSVDLIFHEAGHWIFFPFGHMMNVLGGSLLQLLVPAALLYYFMRHRRDHFASGVMLWWVGENLASISIYMRDANERLLPLLGNGDHDWFVLFNMWGLLPRAELIADLIWHMSIMILLTGLMWALMYSYGAGVRLQVTGFRKK